MLPEWPATEQIATVHITHLLSLKMRQSQGSPNPRLGFQHGYGKRNV